MNEEFTPCFNGQNIKQIIKFELTSLIGRNFKRKKSKIHSDQAPLLLDIGAGENYRIG